MPELPEVETIKRIIEPQISGSVIQKVEVRNEQVIAPCRREFCSKPFKAEVFSSGQAGQVFDLSFRKWNAALVGGTGHVFINTIIIFIFQGNKKMIRPYQSRSNHLLFMN